MQPRKSVGTNVGLANLCLVGDRFVVDSASKELNLQPDPRFGSGMLISEPDLVTRISKGIMAWKELEKKASGECIPRNLHRK
jgi:hypothetical protein